MNTKTLTQAGQRLIVDSDQTPDASSEWFDQKHWPQAMPAEAGRGSTWFIASPVGQAVLKHYRRGGLIARVSTQDYLFTGWSRVRALHEFQLLAGLQDVAGLNVPRPLAAIGWRRGPFYRCALITRFIPHHASLTTMARRGEATAAIWQKTGQSIARLARAGVFHVDLNPDNVLVDEAECIHIIDFDRATQRRHDGLPQVQRLLRGLSKRLAQQPDDDMLANVEEWLHQGLNSIQTRT